MATRPWIPAYVRSSHFSGAFKARLKAELQTYSPYSAATRSLISASQTSQSTPLAAGHWLSESPLFPAHQPKQVDARNAKISAHVGDVMVFSRIALFVGRCLLRHHGAAF